jgi:hypothetical protein
MPELNREYILGLTPGRLNYEIHKRLFDPNIEFNQTVPAYSEDIGLAWKVYEKLLEKHPYLELVHHKAMPGAWEPYYSLRNSTDEFFDQKNISAAKAKPLHLRYVGQLYWLLLNPNKPDRPSRFLVLEGDMIKRKQCPKCGCYSIEPFREETFHKKEESE